MPISVPVQVPEADKIQSVGQELEPAIPSHLRRERTCPLGASKNFKPKYASYAARFDESVTHLPMVYLGVQFSIEAEAAAVIENIKSKIASPSGPSFHDTSRFIDHFGYVNVVFALYWRDLTQYKTWKSSLPEGWWHAGLTLDGQIGVFEETLIPSTMSSETIFTSHRREVHAKLADKMSGTVDSHGYWGSSRDRIPRGQTEDLAPVGKPSLQKVERSDDTKGRLLSVEPHENLCVLRSGQDWCDTEDEERNFYLNRVQPPLEAGMREISVEGGPLGCYFNRYMQVEDDDGPMEKTFSLSAWHSLEELEKWVKTETHLEIYKAGVSHFANAGAAAKLKLYHEMFVLKAEDQSFTYFNCHKETGMLGSVSRV
jgi:aldoxime dehydratase